ncbi:Uncharacterized protein APZ42_023728 [Daphnia magna]|uniref:Uncharacterized protein n=1 Tax=Daphnia magna TaxID=35525 RepID=A0A164UQW4_9CRUS|nr:Uncharacterized protein APZ42_023728 [Daphnia magna]
MTEGLVPMVASFTQKKSFKPNERRGSIGLQMKRLEITRIIVRMTMPETV